MPGAERGHLLFAEPPRGGRRGIAGQEIQRDRALHVSEDGFGARPVRIQQGSELVSCRDPHLDQVAAGTPDGPQCPGLTRVRCGHAQPVLAQPQVLGDHQSITGVTLGARRHLALTPGLDGVRLDRHDRVPASSSASASRPSGRSIATGVVAGSPRRASRRIKLENPAAECAMVN